MDQNEILEKNILNSFSTFSRMLSVGMGLIGVAYFFGWKRLDSYFSAFGSEWMLYEISTVQILSYSYWPIIALFVGMLGPLGDFVDSGHNKNRKIINYFTLIALFFHFGCTIYSFFIQNYGLSAYSQKLFLFAVASVTGIQIGFILDSNKNQNKHSIVNGFSSIFFYFIWFTLSVSSVGHSEGRRDSNKEHSKLPWVMNSKGDKFRLILKTESVAYVTQLETPDGIKILPLEIKEISYFSNREI